MDPPAHHLRGRHILAASYSLLALQFMQCFEHAAFDACFVLAQLLVATATEQPRHRKRQVHLGAGVQKHRTQFAILLDSFHFVPGQQRLQPPGPPQPPRTGHHPLGEHLLEAPYRVQPFEDAVPETVEYFAHLLGKLPDPYGLGQQSVGDRVPRRDRLALNRPRPGRLGRVRPIRQ